MRRATASATRDHVAHRGDVVHADQPRAAAPRPAPPPPPSRTAGASAGPPAAAASPRNPLRDTPTTTDTRARQPSSRRSSAQVVRRRVFPKPMPGSRTMASARDAGRRGAAAARRRGTPRPRHHVRVTRAARCMSRASPACASRTTGTPGRGARAASIAGSSAPADDVVHQVGAGVERRARRPPPSSCRSRAAPGQPRRRARSTGSSRAALLVGGDAASRPGRVDSPPRSSIVGARRDHRPAAAAARARIEVAAAVARTSRGWRSAPPSSDRRGRARTPDRMRVRRPLGAAAARGGRRQAVAAAAPRRPPFGVPYLRGRSRRCRRRRWSRARAAPRPSCAAPRRCGAGAAWRARTPP